MLCGVVGLPAWSFLRIMIFHPASLLFAWGCLAVLLQRIPGDWLPSVGFFIIIAAAFATGRLYRAMLRRARWLFLTLFALFPTMTPGVFLPAPWSLGVLTVDGISAASEHVVRLAAILGLVALLLRVLDQRAIVSGLFVLLRPLAACGVNRERISVRLLLVLDQVAADKRDWRQLLREPMPAEAGQPVRFHVAPFRTCDVALATGAAVVMVLGWLWT